MKKLILLALLIIGATVSYSQEYLSCYKVEKAVKYNESSSYITVEENKVNFLVKFDKNIITFLSDVPHFIETKRTIGEKVYDDKTRKYDWYSYCSALDRDVIFTMMDKPVASAITMLTITVVYIDKQVVYYYFCK